MKITDTGEHMERMKWCKRSLDGLVLGDCFGETFFGKEEVTSERIRNRLIQKEKWHFTDDTIMGIGIYRILEQYGHIDQVKLSKIFGLNYLKDWRRGYGGTAHDILRSLGEGKDFRIVSSKAFDGMGSMGNGAAMRAALIGAYFYDDLKNVIHEAQLSAEITHTNQEGIAGAIAVALAAAAMLMKEKMKGNDFIAYVADNVPECDLKYKIQKGLSIPKESSIGFVVSVLGNGRMVTAGDTVPFAIWCIAHYIDHLEEALWKAVSAHGDMDTICAIVGSVVILNDDTYPKEWDRYVEDPYQSEFFVNE